MQGTSKVESRNVTTPDTLMDLIRQMFPPNLIQVPVCDTRQMFHQEIESLEKDVNVVVQATMQQYRTSLIYPAGGLQNETGKPLRDPNDLSTWAFKGEVPPCTSCRTTAGCFRGVVERLEHLGLGLLRHHPRGGSGQAWGEGQASSQLLHFSG